MSVRTPTNPVARTYARALLEAAGADKRDAMGAGLASLAGVVAQDRDLRTFLETPALDAAAKKQTLEALRGHADDMLIDFLCVVVDRGRVDQLEEIAAAYHELADAAAGRVRAHVATAVPLSEALKKALHAALEGRLKKSILLETDVDPRLIGGVVVQVGNTIYEASVQGWLKQMHKDMLRSSGYED